MVDNQGHSNHSDGPPMTDLPLPGQTLQPTDPANHVVTGYREALQALDVLGSPPDATLDQLVELASWTFNVPLVTLSFFGDEGICHKAHVGVPSSQLTAAAQLLCQALVQQQGYRVVSDALCDTGCRHHPWVTGPLGVRFFAAVALSTVEGVNVGALALMDTIPRELSDREARMLSAMARLAMDHVALQASVRKTTQLREELEQSQGWLVDGVFQDALTQVANRRALMAFLDKTLALSRREVQPLSVVLFDVVGFRRINQAHGDATGDRVLHEVATRLAACARGSELVGRMAGDEFMAVLYPCDASQAELAASRFAQAITERPVALGAASGQSVALRVVTSHVTVDNGLPQTSDELYRQAAQALDQAKTQVD